MIAGMFIRNFKTYQGINYIPIADLQNLSGFLGNNGIGKSSILEAIDTIFNDNSWNYNIVVKKGGLDKTAPYIVPFFILEYDFFNDEILPYAKAIDHIARNIKEDDATNATTKEVISNFILHRKRLFDRYDLSNKLLLPIGQDYNKSISLSIFGGKSLNMISEANFDGISLSREKIISNDYSDFSPLLSYILDYLEYLYIPKEIDSELFTKLESSGTQVLMGESLHAILDRIIGETTVTDINKELNTFLEEISDKLVNYSYRTPTDRQKKIQKREVYNLIIQAFFSVRKLHRKQSEEQYLEINNLSSGEKQKAIIDVAHALLTKHHQNGEKLIIAIDEPESSLHMSACFEQFNALSELSTSCRQLLFSSHWYGFLPTLDKGSVTIITKKNNVHQFDLINLVSYREDIKQLISSSKGKMPFDIRIKSINDFIQSIVSSATGDNPISWLICEGSSEKIYLSAYFNDLIVNNKLRIIPVGGAKEVKRIYEQLAACYKDVSEELTGCIYLLSDTDRQLIRYKTEKFGKLFCKRIVYEPSQLKTILVDIESNPVSPETEIEDCLDGKVYYDTLLTFIEEYPDLEFITDSEKLNENNESRNYLNLRDTEKNIIKEFFDTGNNKYEFSKRYISNISSENITPNWIKEIKSSIQK